MIDGNALIIIEFISGVEGADMFNFFFSLISAGGLLAFVPVAIIKLIQRA
ncbi:MAG: hypothetical protein V6Z89_14410 [Desulfobacter sp.]